MFVPHGERDQGQHQAENNAVDHSDKDFFAPDQEHVAFINQPQCEFANADCNSLVSGRSAEIGNHGKKDGQSSQLLDDRFVEADHAHGNIGQQDVWH